MKKLNNLEELNKYIDNNPDIPIEELANLAPDSFAGLLFKFFLMGNEELLNKLNNSPHRDKQ